MIYCICDRSSDSSEDSRESGEDSTQNVQKQVDDIKIPDAIKRRHGSDQGYYLLFQIYRSTVIVYFLKKQNYFCAMSKYL